LDDVLKHYRETTRYQEHPETQAIVDAKYQLVDLFVIISYKMVLIVNNRGLGN